MKNEPAMLTVKYRVADDIRREQVARELDAPELQTERTGERLGKRRFPHAGHVFDQEMPPGEQADHGELDRRFLADDDIPELANELGDPVSHERGSVG